ncbi:MAG: AarF/ABC1/UbiB kinase family protein, partial [Thermoleophilia bacterium]|nr:AarF/ABC1/UbiB kinase family protein [Thermoleophilia bacterium]
LDPHFDIARQLHPFLRELALRRIHPGRLLGQTLRTAEDMQRVAMLLPDVMLQALESIKRGELTVRFDLQHFENLVRQLTRASNTLAFGILISGLVVASALVLRTGTNSLAYGGFGIALVLLLWLFWNMARD